MFREHRGGMEGGKSLLKWIYPETNVLIMLSRSCLRRNSLVQCGALHVLSWSTIKKFGPRTYIIRKSNRLHPSVGEFSPPPLGGGAEPLGNMLGMAGRPFEQFPVDICLKSGLGLQGIWRSFNSSTRRAVSERKLKTFYCGVIREFGF